VASTDLSSAVYLGTQPADLPYGNGDGWFMALTRTWTDDRALLDALLPPMATGPESAGRVAVRVLRFRSETLIICSPQSAPALRREVGPGLAARVVTWGGSAASEQSQRPPGGRSETYRWTSEE
jgi:hypothetical protein